mgnify:CR=1 FL=1
MEYVPTPDEAAELLVMFRAFDALRKLGWREAIYAPCDGKPFLCIEEGSTGILKCSRDSERRFWIYDGDLWPSRPVLWKPLPAASTAEDAHAPAPAAAKKE